MSRAAAVPAGLAWWADEPGGADWLRRLPRLIGECAGAWSLELGPPFEPAHISYVAGARRADGTEAVLKLNFPEPESEQETDALAWWGGDGAVRLLEHDADRRALLVERCRPGTQLWAVADEVEANRIAAGGLRRLWKPAPRDHPYRLLADETARWQEEIPPSWQRVGRPCPRALIDEFVAHCLELAPSQRGLVVCHQDLHGGNVLAATREPWLAIDPKPLVGEREFDAASLLRDRRGELLADPHPERRLRARLDQLSSELDLDRERIRGWGIVHALAWGLDDDGYEAAHLECARLLTEAR